MGLPREASRFKGAVPFEGRGLHKAEVGPHLLGRGTSVCKARGAELGVCRERGHSRHCSWRPAHVGRRLELAGGGDGAEKGPRDREPGRAWARCGRWGGGANVCKQGG